MRLGMENYRENRDGGSPDARLPRPRIFLVYQDSSIHVFRQPYRLVQDRRGKMERMIDGAPGYQSANATEGENH